MVCMRCWGSAVLLVVMVRAWKKVHRRYRQLLMEAGRRLRGEEDCVVRKGVTPEEFEKAEEARDFELPAPRIAAEMRYCISWMAFRWGVLRLSNRCLRKIGHGWECSEPAEPEFLRCIWGGATHSPRFVG